MRVVLQKSTLFQILFAICVAVTYLNVFELTFGIWLITAFFSIQFVYSKEVLKQFFCYSTILVIAVVVYFFKNHQLYLAIRDVTYLIKPMIGFLIGYNICKKHLNFPFHLIVNTALLIAILHLLILLYAVVVYHAHTVNDLRFYGGYFSDFEIYAIIILIFRKKFNYEISTNKYLLLINIIGISSFLYLARTNFIQFVILFIAMKGYFRITKTSIKVLSSVILLTVLGYSTILYINPKRNGQGIEALLYKIKIAPIEPFKTRINKDDWKDFNDNYRSYENISTVNQMVHSGFTSIMIGEGIGSSIDLKQEVYLGDMMLRYISILHNGFMTIFLKSGLLGLCIYFYSIFLLFKKSKTSIPLMKNINILLLGTGVFLILSNWVFMGLYNLHDNKSMIIGILMAYKLKIDSQKLVKQ